MTNEKWIMVVVSAGLSVLNLLFLRATMRKIEAAKAAGTQIPWILRIQVMLNAVALGGFLVFWVSVLRLYSSQFMQWTIALEAILTGPIGTAIILIAAILAAAPALFTRREND